MRKLREKDLLLKLSKCEFYKKEIVFLGYLISEGQLKLDLAKVRAIEEWPLLKTVKEV
jgi:hypothetical protein